MPSYRIVIPCFNEANRLDLNAFSTHLDQDQDCHITFVDDKSTDQTIQVLRRIEKENQDQVSIVQNKQNIGKADSIRKGILNEPNRTFDFLCYLDADLSAPLSVIPDLIEELIQKPNYSIAFGSRIKNGSAVIKRNELRHYMGRLFTFYVDMLLGINIYDTQCGAKVFRSEIAPQAFENTFTTRWFFDIEIILRVDKKSIIEVPLSTWRDYGGSKLKLVDFLRTPFEIYAIHKKHS